MKKLLSLLLAASLCMVLLASCGSTDTGNASSDKAEASASTSAADNSGDASSAAFETIEEGKLILATNCQFPPYEMVADGEGVAGTGFEGIDIEIAAALAEKYGLELVVDDMDFDASLTAVQQGKSDILLAGLTYTDERAELMDFTDSYAQGVQVIIVKEDSPITSVDDLSNAEMIGTQRGTTGYIYCSDTVENGGFGDDHVAAYDNGAAAVQALLNGQVDAVVIDKLPAETFVAQNEGLKILDTAYTTEDYCLAVQKGNTALLDAMNSTLDEMKQDGTLDAILDKYINAD